MKRIILLVICMASLLVAGGAMATWVPFSGQSASGTSASVTAPVSSANETLVFIDTPGVRVTERIENGETFQVLEIPEFKYINEVGKPQIPAIRKLVAIPAGAAVKVEIVAAEYTPIEGKYRIWPTQPYTLESQPLAPFTIDEDLYAADDAFPQQIAAVSEPMLWRNMRVVLLEVHPVRYIPADGTLEVASRVAVRLRYDGVEGKNALPSEPKAVSPLLVNSYKSAIVNYDSLSLDVQKQGTDDGIDYLILADPEMLTAIQPLADFHAGNGLNVAVVDVSTVGSTSTAIRTYIVEEYESADPPTLDYVLFAADVDVIPLYSWDGEPSDSWYTAIAGDDWMQDFGLGRIPAETPTMMTTVVDKILNYHGGEYAGDWQTKVSLLAHNQNYPGKYTECSEAIRTYTYTYDPPIFDTIYGGEDGTNQMVIDRTNEGRGIVNYRGHGSTTTWSSWDSSDDSFTTAMAHSTENGNMTPVVFSIACLNMALNSSSESFAESWFMQDQGAVAFLGATEPSYTVPNHDFDKNLFKAIYDKAITPIGYILADANYDLITYGGHGSLAETNFKMYLWLGDPATEMPVSALLAPGNLSAQPDGETAIDLTWNDRADNEDGYYVESKTEGGTWSLLDTLDPDSAAYRQEGLSEGTHVYYRVQAFNASMGESNYSNTVHTATLPAAPTNAYAQAMSSDQIYVTWTDNSGGEDGYIIERSAGTEDAFQATATLPADTYAYTDAGLLECETYQYRIKAFNIGGESALSDVATASTMPYAPSGLSANALDESSVKLTWSDNSNGETGYRVLKADATGEFSEAATADAGASTLTVEGLSESTAYIFRVCAIGTDGDSAPSNDAMATTLPAAPAALEAEPMDMTSISLEWEDNSAGEIGFRVYRQTAADDEFVQIAAVAAETTAYTDTGMTEATQATYLVRAFTEEGESKDSEEAITATLPAAPEDLKAFPVSKSKIELTWLDISAGEDGYVVERMGSGDTFDAVATLEASVSSYMDEDLTEGKTYTYRVHAFNAGGDSEDSNEVEVSTLGEPAGGDDDDDDDDDAGCGCNTTGSTSGNMDGTLIAMACLLALLPLARRRFGNQK